MPSPRALLALIALPALLTLGLTGCTKHENTASLPDGATLVSESATAMKAVNTAHIVIDVDGAIGTLPLKRAEGDLKRNGDAKGSLQLLQLGALIPADFVVLGSDVYLKLSTGGWQKYGSGTTAFIYDPSAILDPDRGVAKLLATASNAKTEGSESVDGKDAWRVAVDLDNTAASALVPGVPPGAKGKVWLDKQSKHLLKAVVTTAASGATPAATMTVTLTNIDAPVTITAPNAP
jgi:lipoprotein LprG